MKEVKFMEKIVELSWFHGKIEKIRVFPSSKIKIDLTENSWNWVLNFWSSWTVYEIEFT